MPTGQGIIMSWALALGIKETMKKRRGISQPQRFSDWQKFVGNFQRQLPAAGFDQPLFTNDSQSVHSFFVGFISCVPTLMESRVQ